MIARKEYLLFWALVLRKIFAHSVILGLQLIRAIHAFVFGFVSPNLSRRSAALLRAEKLNRKRGQSKFPCLDVSTEDVRISQRLPSLTRRANKNFFLLNCTLFSVKFARNLSAYNLRFRYSLALFFLAFLLLGCGELEVKLPENQRAENQQRVVKQPHANVGRVEGKVNINSAEYGPTFVYIKDVDPNRSFPFEKSDCITITHEPNAITASRLIGKIDEPIEFVSRCEKSVTVLGDGVVNLGVALPAKDIRTKRVPRYSGPIIFTSGSIKPDALQVIWIAKDPYVTELNAQNEFKIENVPDGEYELCTWSFSKQAKGHERDPETGLVVRKIYDPPMVMKKKIKVVKGETTVELIEARK
jgi:hypothetical protein